MKSMNKCHQCGATSYKPVIKRNDQGAMNMSGIYRCTGCGLEFKTIDEWRKGDASLISPGRANDVSEFQLDLNAATPASAAQASLRKAGSMG